MLIFIYDYFCFNFHLPWLVNHALKLHVYPILYLYVTFDMTHFEKNLQSLLSVLYSPPFFSMFSPCQNIAF